MISEAELEDALSRHIAQAVTRFRTTSNKLGYAVEVFDCGIDPVGAFSLARRYTEATARDCGYADDEARILSEEAAFVAGLVVGRTAREEEGS